MSVLMAVPDMVSAAGHLPAADGFTVAQNAFASLDTTVKTGGGVLGTLIFLIAGWKARGAIAGMVAGLLVAALYVWGVNAVGGAGTRQMVDDTVKINGMPIVQISNAPVIDPAAV